MVYWLNCPLPLTLKMREIWEHDFYLYTIISDYILIFYVGSMLGGILVTKQSGPAGKPVNEVNYMFVF